MVWYMVYGWNLAWAPLTPYHSGKRTPRQFSLRSHPNFSCKSESICSCAKKKKKNWPTFTEIGWILACEPLLLPTIREKDPHANSLFARTQIFPAKLKWFALAPKNKKLAHLHSNCMKFGVRAPLTPYHPGERSPRQFFLRSHPNFSCKSERICSCAKKQKNWPSFTQIGWNLVCEAHLHPTIREKDPHANSPFTPTQIFPAKLKGFALVPKNKKLAHLHSNWMKFGMRAPLTPYHPGKSSPRQFSLRSDPNFSCKSESICSCAKK